MLHYSHPASARRLPSDNLTWVDDPLANGRARVEDGAQGAHKLARGYRPVTTYSAHFIADRSLRRAVDDYLARERNGMDGYVDELNERAPFRRSAPDL